MSPLVFWEIKDFPKHVPNVNNVWVYKHRRTDSLARYFITAAGHLYGANIALLVLADGVVEPWALPPQNPTNEYADLIKIGEEIEQAKNVLSIGRLDATTSRHNLIAIIGQERFYHRLLSTISQVSLLRIK